MRFKMRVKEQISEKKDPKEMPEEYTDSEGELERKFRTLSILSYFVVLILLGIPVWWYTTRVYRAALPLDEIYQLETKSRKTSDFGIPLSLEYDVLVSFVHPEPERLKIDVDVLELEDYMHPFLNRLSSVASFLVKSQWLYLTELGAIPKKVSDHYALAESQLPHVITPLETKLWSHISPQPTLNLVVYFPHCKSPLYIYNSTTNQRSATNTFVSARWGGIYILNPEKSACEAGIFKADVRQMSLVFKQVILELFKLDFYSDDAFSELKVRKIEELLESSKKTLKSLAQLLSEISSIVISDEVADKISEAVTSVNQAENLLANNNLEMALVSAKKAFKNSEEAFGHPSLLALLYFPDDQKYAIYIPLFLPVMIPVIMSLTHLRKRVTTKPKTE